MPQTFHQVLFAMVALLYGGKCCPYQFVNGGMVLWRFLPNGYRSFHCMFFLKAKIRKIGERGKDYFPIVSFTLASRVGISKCCGHFAKHSPQATHEDAGSPRWTGDIETV